MPHPVTDTLLGPNPHVQRTPKSGKKKRPQHQVLVGHRVQCVHVARVIAYGPRGLFRGLLLMVVPYTPLVSSPRMS